MKILLTGGSGMVGKNILNFCESSDFNFLHPTRAELDLLNPVSVNEYLKKNKPDVVIHSAGKVGGIQANIREPVSFLYENSLMGLNLIYSSNLVGIPNFLNLGSSCMYPKDAKNPLTEEQILTGELEPTNEGYAISKITSAKLCEYIVKENPKQNYKTIIPCNLYGLYDEFSPRSSHLVPAIIVKTINAIDNREDSIQIWGDGESRREFMFASDLADFIFFALQNIQKLPNFLNVGLGYDYSINEYYREVADVLGFNGSFEYDLSKPSGMQQKLTNIEKVSKLGWRAPSSLNDGLVKTIKYYKEDVING
ncbi:GDP-L-fucose synthase [Pseudomonadota bacterium]|nr:GDP-L-fucose synthase [Pseudomonadota bacterium]